MQRGRGMWDDYEYLNRVITSISNDYGSIKNKVEFKIAHEKLVRIL